jgi:hypothetical protein
MAGGRSHAQKENSPGSPRLSTSYISNSPYSIRARMARDYKENSPSRTRSDHRRSDRLISPVRGLGTRAKNNGNTKRRAKHIFKAKSDAKDKAEEGRLAYDDDVFIDSKR